MIIMLKLEGFHAFVLPNTVSHSHFYSVRKLICRLIASVLIEAHCQCSEGAVSVK